MDRHLIFFTFLFWCEWRFCNFVLPFAPCCLQFQALQMLRERLNSDGLHSPVEEEDYTIENHLASPSCTALWVTRSLSHTFNAFQHLLYLSTYLFSAETNTYTTLQRNWTQRSRRGNARAKFPPAPRQVRTHCYIIGKFKNCICATSAAISCFFSAGLCLAPRNPHSIFYDYLPEPTFIPPTKRQSDKAGRHRAKDKKENCKQQWTCD